MKPGLTKDRLDATPEWQEIVKALDQALIEVTEHAISAHSFAEKEYFHGYRDALKRIRTLPEEMFKDVEEEEEPSLDEKRPSLFSWSNPEV